MEQQLYYQSPEDHVFEEVKNACLHIWDGYDDTYGYATGKKQRVEGIENVKDNMMYMIGMFDLENIEKLSEMLTPETNQIIKEKLLSVDNRYIASLF